MKDPLFSKIVSTKRHECTTLIPVKTESKDPGDIVVPQMTPFKMVWNNSNKLLQIEGFKGVKTGITQTAGPCLCILYDCVKTPG